MHYELGLPVRTQPGNMIFNEVDCAQRLLKYKTTVAGMCTILQHPRWGTSVYPASIVTNADQELLKKAILSLSNSH